MRPGLRTSGRLVAALVIPPLVGACERDRGGRAADPRPAATRSTASAPVLPRAGTEIPLFPPGEARDVVQAHCLACHASEMIQQQRLTEAQWRAEIDKMQRWGADIRDEDKAVLLRYLVSRFGPDNDRFTPIVASPEVRSVEAR